MPFLTPFYIAKFGYAGDKNKNKLRSFKSSEHINEKADGPYHGFDYLCRGVPIFLILLQNIDCGYSLEPPCRGVSNVHLLSMF